MEGRIICVVIIVGAVQRRAAQIHQIVAFKEEIHILEAHLSGVLPAEIL